MSHSYRGWAEAIFGCSHQHQLEINDWDGGGKTPAFGTNEEASGDYELHWRGVVRRYILPESYSGGSSYFIWNCAEAMETMMSLRTAPLAETGHRETHPLGDDLGEGTSGGATPDIESVLREEVSRLSELVKEKEITTMGLQASFAAKERDLRKELKLRDAVIDALAGTHKDLAGPEAMGIAPEGELQKLQAEVDRLQEEARSERDRALGERVASAAQVDELRARLKSFEVPAQSSAIVASIPPPLSLGEEKALIHDQYARRMDHMALHHEEVVADLRRRLDRYRQRAGERGYAFSDSFRAPSQRAPSPSSFASSARHGGAAP